MKLLIMILLLMAATIKAMSTAIVSNDMLKLKDYATPTAASINLNSTIDTSSTRLTYLQDCIGILVGPHRLPPTSNEYVMCSTMLEHIYVDISESDNMSTFAPIDVDHPTTAESRDSNLPAKTAINRLTSTMAGHLTRRRTQAVREADNSGEQTNRMLEEVLDNVSNRSLSDCGRIAVRDISQGKGWHGLNEQECTMGPPGPNDDILLITRNGSIVDGMNTTLVAGGLLASCSGEYLDDAFLLPTSLLNCLTEAAWASDNNTKKSTLNRAIAVSQDISAVMEYFFARGEEEVRIKVADDWAIEHGLSKGNAALRAAVSVLLEGQKQKTDSTTGAAANPGQ